ncbi:MAG TPA: S-methyl-5'-thioadenosine phosphorylase [Polyangiaceae bacterium LLY-WYZ-15_(1-7)]|nr:S-methyl-5'-thioadenosine phosphorylase [Myxococcales bacterium]MAT27953.1 S-methyl-5'-thioadenosine phosphorylase [Sandaracinus sp.]HJK90194.1 S-methyl-5'-thioadenosine phosphorylase [Polyangiaceae bacterium LLY-WYZ-15_(1-7)]MBJ71227.1 S-methyl-5'-thioadenosine phosphorylase [Sandaracinus sp.]HJL06098.1 S-methyl-5'-thioadenosine phosphorylase [Polyangiaceae bacterium LLY-WYZ-15_(1-7)]
MTQRTVGVIGGSGLYEMEGLEGVEEHVVETTYGAPSDAVVSGTLGDTRMLFLPRHGRGHRMPPHQINYRANILALKQLGAEQLISVSAVGSMKESIRPGDMVVVDQFIDRTRTRPSTFFEDIGVVAHVEFAEPVDGALAEALYRASVEVGARVHHGGTYVCIEGPQFSTRAESNLYRSWGVDVIGMTNLPEARLAREAELPYATLALATDYDCWHTDHASVTVEAVLDVMRKNIATAKAILKAVAPKLPDASKSPATNAMEHAIMTARDRISDDARTKLKPLVGRYLD